MRRSKMEMHLDILKILAQKGPLKLTHIMYKANVNCSVLKEYLDFLIQQELIAEKIIPDVDERVRKSHGNRREHLVGITRSILIAAL